MAKFQFKAFLNAISSELLVLANNCGTANEFRTLLSDHGMNLNDFCYEEPKQPEFEPVDPDIEEDLFCMPHICADLPCFA